MKNLIHKLVHLAALFLVLLPFVANSQSIDQGRIAIIADGNYRDPDDIAGTPVSLAILRAYGLEDKLVHYSHSCDLIPGSNDPGGDFREEEMQISCDGTASSWGGFEHISTFFNAIRDQQETIDDLAEHINNASNTNPLWIIEAGEPDIIYEAVKKADAATRDYVYIVTHHPANDNGDFHDLEDIMALGIPDDNLHRIPNQNTLLKKDLDNWHWARDHNDERINWLWERGYIAQTDAVRDGYSGIIGDFDCSDAGMVYYWATLPTGGDRNCDVPKLKNLFLDYVNSAPNNLPQGSFLIPTFDTIDEGYNELRIEVDASDPDGDSITLTLFIDGNEIRTERNHPYQWGFPSQPQGETLNLTAGDHLLEVEITDARNASTKISKIITVTDSTLSMNDIENQDIVTLYPNPVKNTLFISGNTTGKTVRIYDLLGAVRTTKKLIENENNINLSNFAAGLYIVRILDLNNTTSNDTVYKIRKVD